MKTSKIDRQGATPSLIENIGAVRYYQILVWRDDLQMYSSIPWPNGTKPNGAPKRIAPVFGLKLAQSLAYIYRENGFIAILRPLPRTIPLSFSSILID